MPTPKPETKPTEPTKKRAPTPSPEFVEARTKRDLRILKEREDKLTKTFADKMTEITNERSKLTAELEAAQKRMGTQVE